MMRMLWGTTSQGIFLHKNPLPRESSECISYLGLIDKDY